ncbi:hypothetical protein Tco_0652927 [Tanacetum coccineum]|uniref:Uncharacterized protein n=1 Tax=Tanacetum coccineum TaxID=301880 RepID=A0ABQ4WZ93_9ASTR
MAPKKEMAPLASEPTRSGGGKQKKKVDRGNGVMYLTMACKAVIKLRERHWEKFAPLKGSVEIEQYARTLHKETNSLYWVAAKGNKQGCHVILKLNIEELIFHELPFSTKVKGVPINCLGIVEGKLCTLTREYMGSNLGHRWACDVVKHVFVDADDVLDNLDEKSCQESSLKLMNILRLAMELVENLKDMKIKEDTEVSRSFAPYPTPMKAAVAQPQNLTPSSTTFLKISSTQLFTKNISWVEDIFKKVAKDGIKFCGCATAAFVGVGYGAKLLDTSATTILTEVHQ